MKRHLTEKAEVPRWFFYLVLIAFVLGNIADQDWVADD